MTRMVVVPKDVIDAWIKNKKVACYPGSEQFLAMACHIASQHDLPARGLTARLLPDGNVRVTTPFESAHWPKPAQEVKLKWFDGFCWGVFLVILVWTIKEVVTSWN